tara:strand:+ start:326 stop:970 length:645 start_codon:yes stop_codon:yes gene_type:complete
MTNNSVSYNEWLEARDTLLAKEKALTRHYDALAAERQALPVVRVEKPYLFSSDSGECSLADLFEDVSQLIVYHFMFGEDWDATCSGCTQWANAFNGTTEKFASADARLVAVSSASIEKITAEKLKRGWTFEWYSQGNSDFGVDFHVSSHDPTEKSRTVGGQTVNFDRGENHGISVFKKDEAGNIYLTYSCFNRGVEPMNGAFAYYDLLPNGRQW